MKIKSDLQTFPLPSPKGWGGACFLLLLVPSRGDGKAAACGSSWALLEWGPLALRWGSCPPPVTLVFMQLL